MKPCIVILSAFLSPLRSGAEACAEEVPLALRNTYDFAIVTARMQRDLPKRDVLHGGNSGAEIPVVRVGFGCTFDKWLFPFLAPLAARKLRPQVLHAVLESFAGLALFFCRFLVPEAKRLLTLQTTNRQLLRGPIVRSPHAVTAISRVLQDQAKEMGCSEVSRIPNGVDLAAIKEACATHAKVPGRVLFVGRLEHMKGVDVLLYAFKGVSHIDAHLHIVGEGSKRSELEALATKLGIADRVTITGRLIGANLYKEYAQAQIFCGLSRSEALGNVFLEAQAAGCAIVATHVGGIPDVVRHGEQGMLVEEPSQAAEALRQLLTQPDLLRSCSVAARENAKNYDWKSIASKYAAVYDALLSRAS